MEYLRISVQAQLICSKYSYLFVKSFLFAFLGSFVLYLYIIRAENEAMVAVITSDVFILLLLISWWLLYKNMEAFLSANGLYSEYIYLIPLEIFILFVVVGGYYSSMIYLYLNYEEKRHEIYSDHTKYSKPFEMKELKKNPQYLDDNALINDHIETTTKFIIENTIKIQSRLFSALNLKERSSNLNDTQENEKNVTNFKPTIYKSPDQKLIDYKNFIGIICYSTFVLIILQLVVVGLLGLFEHAKFRKRHEPQPNQDELEMNELNNEADGNN